MLVSFVVDVESLASDQTWSPATLRACHHQILDVWKRIGLLVHDGEQFEKSNLYHAISSLPPSLKILWLEMAKQSPPVPCAKDWDGSVSLGHVQDLCSDAALALVDDTRAEVEFGFTENQDEIAFTEIEDGHFVVCRLQAAQNASVVQEAFAISQRNIEVGERYQDIWKSRFRSLASAPSSNLKRIAIVDRYAIEQHFRCPQGRLSGLERFLRLLDEHAGAFRYVTLYSAWTTELSNKDIRNVETEIENLVRKLPKGNVKRLTICMIPNSKFGTNARDRYVRFGCYVWELGHGLDIFEGPAAGHLCQASFKADAESHSRVEQELERQVQPHAIKIVRRG